MSLALLLAVFSLSVASAVAPGLPQNLIVTVSGNTVTLRWQPPTTGGVPSSYVIEAASSPGGASIASLPVPGTTLSVPNVPNGVYYIRVRGVNGDGTSEASNEVIVVVPGGGGGCSSPPNPPQNLTGSATGNIVNLTWSSPVGGCAATSYAMQAGSASGRSDITVVNVGAVTALSAGAPAGTYYLRVVALNAFGGSTSSNEIAVTVGSPCLRPAAPILQTPTVSGSTVTFTWIAPGGPVTGYIVEAGSGPGATNLLNTMTGATTYSWTNAPTGTHYIRVRAINACGTGFASNEVRVERDTGSYVRTLYVIPQDRAYRSDYATAIEAAMTDLRQWFSNQLGGRTFDMFREQPEVCRLPRPASEYAVDTWSKVFSDVQACAPVAYGGRSIVWVLYVDVVHACNAPGRLGAGASGVTMLPRQDMDGLIGARYVDDCGIEYRFPPSRYVGGLGHELGHALGLPHPPGCDQGLPTCDGDALMWSGYARYPNTYLRPEEKQRLLSSGFFR